MREPFVVGQVRTGASGDRRMLAATPMGGIRKICRVFSSIT